MYKKPIPYLHRRFHLGIRAWRVSKKYQIHFTRSSNRLNFHSQCCTQIPQLPSIRSKGRGCWDDGPISFDQFLVNQASPNVPWKEYFMHAHMWTPIETQQIQFILMISNFIQIHLQTAEQSAQSFTIDTHSENSHQTKLREESSIGLPVMFGLRPFANPVLFSCQLATTVLEQLVTSDSFIRWAQIWCQEVAMSGSNPAVDPCMTPVTLSRGTDQDLITNHYAIVWSTIVATCQGELQTKLYDMWCARTLTES